jgi:hypothetical protein
MKKEEEKNKTEEKKHEVKYKDERNVSGRRRIINQS